MAEQSRKLKKGRTAMLKIVFGLGAGCLILAIGKINKAGLIKKGGLNHEISNHE